MKKIKKCSKNKNFNDEIYDVFAAAEFIKSIKIVRTNSFNKQVEYLEKVFNLINKNDDILIQTYLKNNQINENENINEDYINVGENLTNKIILVILSLIYLPHYLTN